VRAALAPASALGHVGAAARGAAERAGAALAAAGAVVTEATVPAFGDWGRHRATVIGAEALTAHRAAGWWPARAGAYPEEIRRQLEAAETVPAAEVERAREALTALGRSLRAELVDAGLLITPTLPVPAPLRTQATGSAAAELKAAGLLTRLCGPVNAAGLAAVSVPAGTADGVPLGVQLIAAGERRLLAAAAALAAVAPAPLAVREPA
jgi:aspartyl-tRNA(Asn)/glutamyl-tRNA(Gln) amidotransferase subunit A